MTVLLASLSESKIDHDIKPITNIVLIDACLIHYVVFDRSTTLDQLLSWYAAFSDCLLLLFLILWLTAAHKLSFRTVRFVILFIQ